MNTLKHILMYTVMAATFAAVAFMVGCIIDGGFAGETYVWENWNVSTNAVEVVE